MKIVIDRFEGNFAIVELPERQMLELNKRFFPDTAKEGDVFEIKITAVGNEERKVQINQLMKEVWDDHQ